MNKELSRASLMDDLERYAVTSTAAKKAFISRSQTLKISNSVTKLVRPTSKVNFIEDLFKPSDHGQSHISSQDKLSDSSEMNEIVVNKVKETDRSSMRHE